MANKKKVIGREITVDFGEIKDVPAKVDTGADSSAIWASNIFVDKDHNLHFKLFDKQSPYYTGTEHVVHEFSVAQTRSSLGEVALKYRVKIPICMAGRKVRATFGLSERSGHNYPILIGRRTLSGKFIVDVSQTENLVTRKRTNSESLNEKMKKNPYKFYKEYYQEGKQK